MSSLGAPLVLQVVHAGAGHVEPRVPAVGGHK